MLTHLVAKSDLSRYEAIYIPYSSHSVGMFIPFTAEILMCLMRGGRPRPRWEC